MFCQFSYCMVETCKHPCGELHQRAVSITGYILYVSCLNFLLITKIAVTMTGRVPIALTLGPFHPSPVLALRIVYTCLSAVFTRLFCCPSVMCIVYMVICSVIFTSSLEQNKLWNHLICSKFAIFYYLKFRSFQSSLYHGVLWSRRP